MAFAFRRRVDRARLRIGIPRVLNVWNTAQFWIGFLVELGIPARQIVFSSDTTEEQFRTYAKGRTTVDCCYPVKAISGHYGELCEGQDKPIDILLSPMIYSLPSHLKGHVVDTLCCPRVMAAPENIRAGFQREADWFAERRVRHVAPFVTLGEPNKVAEQLHAGLGEVLDLGRRETERAVRAGFAALGAFDAQLRAESRAVLGDCERDERPCVLVLARPYHMDPGLGHEIEAELQAEGLPILWSPCLPVDEDYLDRLFGAEVRAGRLRSPFDLSDVWRSSYSSNTNEILWAAKFAARCPWITCCVRLSSYECGMDQPTFTPTQRIVEGGDTLYFKFGDLDSTKAPGAVRIRIETITHYVRQYSAGIIAQKRRRLADSCAARVVPCTRTAAPAP